MKNFLIALTLFAACLNAANAAPTAAITARLTFSTASVGLVNWNPLLYTTKAIKALTVYNSNPSPLAIGYALISTGSNAEVQQLTVPGALASGQPSMALYPLSVSQGYRLSVLMLGSVGSTGEVLVNAHYN
jgi:hypothetical protein